jgi:hypothetical protein
MGGHMRLGVAGKSVIEYVPKYRGNRELPPEEQVKVKLRLPTYGEILSLPSVLNVRFADQDDPNTGVKIMEWQIRNCVAEVHNLSLDGININDGNALWDLCPASDMGLILELAEEIGRLGNLSEEQEKNLESPSGGMPLGETGTA